MHKALDLISSTEKKIHKKQKQNKIPFISAQPQNEIVSYKSNKTHTRLV
jgi:hypothetical protein